MRTADGNHEQAMPAEGDHDGHRGEDRAGNGRPKLAVEQETEQCKRRHEGEEEGGERTRRSFRAARPGARPARAQAPEALRQRRKPGQWICRDSGRAARSGLRRESPGPGAEQSETRQRGCGRTVRPAAVRRPPPAYPRTPQSRAPTRSNDRETATSASMRATSRRCGARCRVHGGRDTGACGCRKPARAGSARWLRQ